MPPYKVDLPRAGFGVLLPRSECSQRSRHLAVGGAISPSVTGQLFPSGGASSPGGGSPDGGAGGRSCSAPQDIQQHLQAMLNVLHPGHTLQMVRRGHLYANYYIRFNVYLQLTTFFLSNFDRTLCLFVFYRAFCGFVSLVVNRISILSVCRQDCVPCSPIIMVSAYLQACRLESVHGGRVRYLSVVSCVGRMDQVEAALIGADLIVPQTAASGTSNLLRKTGLFPQDPNTNNRLNRNGLFPQDTSTNNLHRNKINLHSSQRQRSTSKHVNMLPNLPSPSRRLQSPPASGDSMTNGHEEHESTDRTVFPEEIDGALVDCNHLEQSDRLSPDQYFDSYRTSDNIVDSKASDSNVVNIQDQSAIEDDIQACDEEVLKINSAEDRLSPEFIPTPSEDDVASPRDGAEARGVKRSGALRMTIGLVMPLLADTSITLDGDGSVQRHVRHLIMHILGTILCIILYSILCIILGIILYFLLCIIFCVISYIILCVILLPSMTSFY